MLSTAALILLCTAPMADVGLLQLESLVRHIGHSIIVASIPDSFFGINSCFVPQGSILSKQRRRMVQQHLREVVELCHKHNLKPMAYTDPLFRLASQTNNYYDPKVGRQRFQDLEVVSLVLTVSLAIETRCI